MGSVVVHKVEVLLISGHRELVMDVYKVEETFSGRLLLHFANGTSQNFARGAWASWKAA